MKIAEIIVIERSNKIKTGKLLKES